MVTPGNPIAQTYNLSTDNLKRWNAKITTPEPAAGDLVRLTKPKAKRYVQYTVKSSDSLKSIAKKYDCSVEDIRTWNGLDKDAKISKGDVLFERMRKTVVVLGAKMHDTTIYSSSPS